MGLLKSSVNRNGGLSGEKDRLANYTAEITKIEEAFRSFKGPNSYKPDVIAAEHPL